MPGARSAAGAAVLVRMAEITNRTVVLPLLVVFPTSRCHSACVSCDWWKSSGERDLSVEEFAALADTLPGLGTQLVLFSGGEPLLRSDVFLLAHLFRARGLRLHLLTSGVQLEGCAHEVAASFERVIVSLDASTEALYRRIRGVSALRHVERGVALLRQLARHLPITARATLHRHNFRELPRLIDHARAMGLDGISFLAADVSSGGFGREQPGPIAGLALTRDEVAEFAEIVETTISGHADDLASGFVREPAQRLRRLPQYYAAMLGDAPFPPVACNAPWMSVVVQADGDVRPCFFHPPIGNVRETPLPQLIATNLPAFRKGLDVAANDVCRRCVCAIRTNWRNGPWQE
jgi:MoaA/NifB/PqqE/SkfB family radical SAM enzyme